jgi:hypothetical protein
MYHEGSVARKKAKSERRGFKRFRSNFMVKSLDLSSGTVANCILYDIAAQGLGIVTSQRVEEKSMRFWLHFPDNKRPLRTQGRVVWQRLMPNGGFRVGISLDKPYFLGISRLFRS